MKLSIIVPVYNEDGTIEEIISRIKKVDLDQITKEVIIVNDGSSAIFKGKIENKIAPLVEKVVHHGKNLGKGAAVRTGLNYVTGDFVLIQDGDLEYNPEDYNILLKPLLNNKADVVFGSRFLNKSSFKNLTFYQRLANTFLTYLSNRITKLKLTDMETCYKLFRTKIIKSINIKENKFGLEPELTIKMAKMNCRVHEVGISYKGRSYRDGKKISFKDALRAIYVLLKYGIFEK